MVHRHINNNNIIVAFFLLLLFRALACTLARLRSLFENEYVYTSVHNHLSLEQHEWIDEEEKKTDFQTDTR